jgi:glycosyltransferase involved in cell wall biosynthesis
LESVPSARILFVCGVDFRGPSELHGLAVAERLLAAGQQTMISISGDPGTLAIESSSPIDRGNGPRRVLVHRHRHTGLRLRRHDLAAARRFMPTMIHAWNARLPEIVAARSYAEATGAPVFVHFTDDEWGIASGGEIRSRPLARRLMRPGGSIHAPLWPYATERTFEWARVNAAGIDAIAPALSAHVEQRLGRSCTTLLPVLPGESERVDRTEASALLDRLEGTDVIAFTGAVFGAHIDDFLLGLRAVARLQSEGRKVAFVYTGRLARRFNSRRLVLEAGLDQNAAHFLGYVSRAAVDELLRRASVLIQPGRPSEFNRLRLPIKLVRYLASGTPTVTFGVGIGELLAQREEALKTAGGTVDELADRLREVLDDDALRGRLRLGGPRAAHRLFDPERNTSALLDHYASCLGSAPMRDNSVPRAAGAMG